MNSVISKTFGGLSKQYYFRQFIFGLIFPALMFFVYTQTPQEVPKEIIIFSLISTFLYPYSRFVYESVVGFILGENLFIVNSVLVLVVKFITMYFYWCLAVFIAPIGLGYLYYYYTKNEN